MMTVYKSLIRPHLEYCVQLWNPAACHGNWKIILEIENVQRNFTRRINDIGLLSYRDRLIKCGITTLAERRARGDLIECFKIWKGLVDYGTDMLKISRSGYKLILQSKSGTRKYSSFPDRIVSYWNKLPAHVKDAETTEGFKSQLELFKTTSFRDNSNMNTGQFWDISEEVLAKIESSQENRESYVSFMSDNPNVAHRRFINVSGSG